MNKEYKHKINQELGFYKSSYKNYIIGWAYQHERFFEGRYMLHMRYVQYYSKSNSLFSRLLYYYHFSRMNYYSLKTGLQLLSNIDFGVRIFHFGSIVINGAATIGKNLTIYPGVTIGQTDSKRENTPIIGDNVYIYPNAMVCGKITIGDNVIILSNSVVTHDVPSNSIVGGIPAKIIRSL